MIKSPIIETLEKIARDLQTDIETDIGYPFSENSKIDMNSDKAQEIFAYGLAVESILDLINAWKERLNLANSAESKSPIGRS